MAKKRNEEEVQDERKFTRSEILSSSTYINDRDLLSVLLFESEEYTTKEVDKLIFNWKGEAIC